MMDQHRLTSFKDIVNGASFGNHKATLEDRQFQEANPARLVSSSLNTGITDFRDICLLAY
jgi:hypothetical protein